MYLDEALDRLGIEKKSRKRILFHELSKEKFSGGFGFYDPFFDVVRVFSTGGQVVSDHILAHELEHRKQRRRLFELLLKLELEPRAEEETLKRLSELEAKYPNVGYGKYRAGLIERIKAYQDGRFGYSDKPIRRVMEIIRNKIYFEKINLGNLD
jgi:hypothetical protein